MATKTSMAGRRARGPRLQLPQNHECGHDQQRESFVIRKSDQTVANCTSVESVCSELQSLKEKFKLVKTLLEKSIGGRRARCPETRLTLMLLLFWFSAAVVALAQPVPHHFSGITVLPDQSVTLSLDGSISNMFNLSGLTSNQFRQMFDLYVVEASTNLTDWTPLARLLRTNNDPNPLLFQDTNTAGLSQRFYRTFTNHLLTSLPKPTGPFAVGTFSRILTDSTRSNRYGLKTNSSFMSTFWYPVESPRAGSLPGAYADRAVAADGAFYSFWSWSKAWTNVLPQCVAHAVPGLPLAPGTNRLPVILHSHGWTCDRTLNSHNAEELASHGYVVAAVDHEDRHATVFPNELGVRYVPPSWSRPAGAVAALFRSRTNDLECLLQALGQMEADDGLLAGRLDLDRIGLMGFSMGGGAAAETARLDGRVKCVALLDAYIDFTHYPGLNSQALPRPLLAMNSTIPHPVLGEFSAENQRLFTLATKNAIWLKIANTSHFAFCDCAWTVDMTSDSRRGALAIDACLVWFFDTYLKGETPLFPTNPEIYDVRRK